MMYVAVMRVSGNGRLEKFASFFTAAEAQGHIDRFTSDYPNAFVAQYDGLLPEHQLKWDGSALVYDPTTERVEPTVREKIVARLKRDPELRALIVSYRDDNGLTNQQVLDRLEAKYAESIE